MVLIMLSENDIVNDLKELIDYCSKNYKSSMSFEAGYAKALLKVLQLDDAQRFIEKYYPKEVKW